LRRGRKVRTLWRARNEKVSRRELKKRSGNILGHGGGREQRTMSGTDRWRIFKCALRL